MKAIGLTCGVGSMLIGARNAGFDVVGNVEWRKYYHHRDAEGRNTFEMNFPGAFFVKKVGDLTTEQIEAATGCDIAFGHPECGNFSNLNQNKSSLSDPGDIPLFAQLVNKLKPRFFVMDNLSKSLIGFPIESYNEILSDYNLFPEWINNHGYGNIQKHRKRFFLIGSLKSENFTFAPGEFEHNTSLSDTIGDIADNVGSISNHSPVDHFALSSYSHLKEYGKKYTYGELSEEIRDLGEGKNIPYVNKEGIVKRRMDSNKLHWKKHSNVLIGSPSMFHPLRCTPLTIRERARIQGAPDDFVFYGEVLNEKGEHNPSRNQALSKQTGKFMPVQFCTYIAEQIAAHIKGEPFDKATGKRFLKPDPYISEAKRWYCKNVGYSNQAGACEHCHINKECEGPQLSIPEE